MTLPKWYDTLYFTPLMAWLLYFENRTCFEKKVPRSFWKSIFLHKSANIAQNFELHPQVSYTVGKLHLRAFRICAQIFCSSIVLWASAVLLKLVIPLPDPQKQGRKTHGSSYSGISQQPLNAQKSYLPFQKLEIITFPTVCIKFL